MTPRRSDRPQPIALSPQLRKRRQQDALKARTQQLHDTAWRAPPGRLTPEKVRIIMVDPRSDAELAIAFGVATDTVNKVRRGLRWRSVTGLTEIQYKPRLLRYGEDSVLARLDADSARMIYLDKREYRDIADSFGVSYATVRNIKRGQRWRHATLGLPRPKPWYIRRRRLIQKQLAQDDKNG